MLRPEQLEDQIQFLLANLVQRNLKDPDLGFVTLTAVRLTGDRSLAKVYFTVLGEKGQAERTQKALTRAAGFLRSHLAKRLSLRRIPELRFYLDGSVDDGNRMEELFSKIREEEAMRGPVEDYPSEEG
ncbi:MAG: 30S ribosome-binding factor RbfA [Holophagales bacterium]|jgi:ribosome-binding factor A|nr:30S ribosome-binding factor RbfA [Holophagales bacterium]